MSSRTRYRVRFSQWLALAVDLIADSPEEAIATAHAMQDHIGSKAFEQIDHGTDHWEAEPVEEVTAFEVEQLTTALTRLRRPAYALLCAIEGVTDQFDHETRDLAQAIATVDLALLNRKGGVR